MKKNLANMKYEKKMSKKKMRNMKKNKNQKKYTI